jgi:hypothetical protein
MAMGPFALLVLATPFWGYQLSPPTMPSALLDPVVTTQLADAQLGYGGTAALDTEAEQRADAQNRMWMDWTRGMSAASLAALALTGIFGFVQFGDQYGFHSSYNETACAHGTGVFESCGTTPPYVHATAAGTTALLTTATLVLSSQVDFDRAARIDGDWRTYEVTRWVQFGLLVAQAIGGFLLANATRFGWADEARDFDTLQGFGVAHMALGAAALGMQLYNTVLLF